MILNDLMPRMQKGQKLGIRDLYINRDEAKELGAHLLANSSLQSPDHDGSKLQALVEMSMVGTVPPDMNLNGFIIRQSVHN